jgi:Kef-type K+ transport system membrane component KefB
MAVVETIILQLFIIFLLAKIASEILAQMKMPSMIGEVAVGIVLGYYFLSSFDESMEILEVLSELGVIFLLFIIGMETRFSDLRWVGKLAFSVGILGVVFPFIFGVMLIIAYDAWPGVSFDGDLYPVAMFVGTAMVATSIGITARVLREMNVMNSNKARIIMGAAVIDDVLGMIVLTVVSGMASDHELPLWDLLIVIIEAILFILITMFYGEKIIRKLAGDRVILGVRVRDEKRDHFAKLEAPHGPFIFALILCLGLSAVSVIFFRLAAIIGAFLAGMMFAEVRERYRLVEKMEPMNEFLVPFFFVFIGMQVKLDVFGELHLVGLIIAIIILAIIGKVMGSWIATPKLATRTRLIIGVGMMPRGEVGIIVASVGLSLAIIDTSMYSVIILMSVITTLLAPPLLKVLFAKKSMKD